MSSFEHGTRPARPPQFLSRLNEAQCQRLHEATLQCLERTGLIVDEPEALELLRAAGAQIDGNRVRIPEKLVGRAFETVPRSVSLYDRDGREAIRCTGYETSFGTGSDCMYCFDHRTQTRRRAVLQDVIDGARVAQACPNIDFLMSLFTPSDVTPEVMDRYQLEVLLSYSSKPVVFVTMNDPTAHFDALEMAEIVRGGRRELAERPLVACYKNTLFPLVHNAEAVRTLLDLAERGIPCIYSPVSTAGTVAPISVAGAAVVVNAGVLAGLVMSQLKREGAPYIAIGWAGEAMDMRTMVDAYCWPDHRAVYSSLLHWYDLPMWTLGGISDSKLPDQQAAAEATLTLVADALSGGHMIHDVGYLESAYCGSLTQVVLCDEVIGWLRSFAGEVDLSDEALALDVIDEVGPGGLFLRHKHTRRHVRDRHAARLFDRSSRQDWVAAGGLDATARAARRVDEILAADPNMAGGAGGSEAGAAGRSEAGGAGALLDSGLRARLHAVVEAAERRLR
jgi:trimethylamine--corrinoid protein Co-methyltransferase